MRYILLQLVYPEIHQFTSARTISSFCKLYYSLSILAEHTNCFLFFGSKSHFVLWFAPRMAKAFLVSLFIPSCRF